MSDSDVKIDAERFFERLERLQTEWISNKNAAWGGADALCIPMGSSAEDISYSKSSSMHLYLLGFEFPDSVILFTRNNFYFMATSKKCAYLERSLLEKNGPINIHILKRSKDEAQTREHFDTLVAAVRKNGGHRIGSLFKSEYRGNFIPSWISHIADAQLEKVEIAPALGTFFAVKDPSEMDFCKRAAVLSNKVMKHGFTQEMETVIDNDSKISHETLAGKVESIIFDPSKIGVKVSADAVDICFSPIIQSGGRYDIKVSAQSDGEVLSPDIIICSLGARYKGYCANISRTFMVDAPKKVSKTYGLLLSTYNACLEKMIPGNELKDVLEGAKTFLRGKDPDLLSCLPKSLGFAMGLEFRDGTHVLNGTNAHKFKPGMIFNLAVGLHNVPLSAEDKEGAPDAIRKLEAFSLLVADCVCVQKEGVPEVLTKCSKEYSDVSYNMTGDKDEDGEEADDDEDPEGHFTENGVRRSGRNLSQKIASDSVAQKRAQRQQELMQKKIEEARKKISSGGNSSGDDGEEVLEASDLATYKSEEEFPRDMPPNRVKVDMQKEALLLPINGRHVPFHISTIKNMTNPDPDMRINFHIPGKGAMSKEVPKNMQQLIVKYGDQYVFMKELTFRSMDGKNLSTVYQQYQELRRRVRQREQKAEQEKDLVVQTKLIRIKDQRIPRLQEVTMRPSLSGRKCVGTLEAHQNGLRFTSTKSEILDVMYVNIKHAIFQPCDRTTMVLVHFHLKDFIMIGKKKQKDVQFYTEVVESSVNLDGSRRSSYDPDELDDEQREREMKKRLNIAFKEFCSKVEKVAAHYEYDLMIDVPFKKSGFTGNPFKEMVTMFPTTNCLVNLTETPPFVLTMSDVEHVHFERVTYATKNFDLTFIFKDYNLPPRSITAVDIKFMETIQDWLNLIEITYTVGPRSMNWSEIMKAVKGDADVFYNDTDEFGGKKPAGWLFLSAEASDDEDEEGEDADEDSSFGGGEEGESDESDDSEDSDDDDGSDFASEDSSDEEDEEEELEEKGMSWDEMEREAKAHDRAKRNIDENEQDPRAVKKPKRR